MVKKENENKQEVKKDDKQLAKKPLTNLSIKKEVDLLGEGQAKTKMAQSIAVANVARKVISDKHLFCKINDNQYVYVKGWKLIANLAGLVPTIDVDKTKIERETEYYEKNGKQVAVKRFSVTAVAYLLDRHGVKHGTAIGLCNNREGNWAGREESAIVGMAQTRAIGRACKNALDWLVSMAGYEDVPVEEITDAGFKKNAVDTNAESLKISEGKK